MCASPWKSSTGDSVAAERAVFAHTVVLVGPTASGKSHVALELAARQNGEIVGADSRQIYRGLEIGTEAPTEAERARIPHHFVASLEPSETYSAGRYGREARRVVTEIAARRKLPIVAGGSGLYVRALLQGLFEGPARDETVRARLSKRLHEEGLEALRRDLQRVDPAALARITPGDPVRVIRALEVYELTGRPISALRKERARAPIPARVFGLRWPREHWKDRIAARLDSQLERGFLDETRRLLAAGLPEQAPGPKTLGYRELIRHLRGELTLEEARAQIVLRTRQLAKRQDTWFRHTEGVEWFELSAPTDLGRALDAIESRIDRGEPKH